MKSFVSGKILNQKCKKNQRNVYFLINFKKLLKLLKVKKYREKEEKSFIWEFQVLRYLYSGCLLYNVNFSVYGNIKSDLIYKKLSN